MISCNVTKFFIVILHINLKKSDTYFLILIGLLGGVVDSVHIFKKLPARIIFSYFFTSISTATGELFTKMILSFLRSLTYEFMFFFRSVTEIHWSVSIKVLNKELNKDLNTILN